MTNNDIFDSAIAVRESAERLCAEIAKFRKQLPKRDPLGAQQDPEVEEHIDSMAPLALWAAQAERDLRDAIDAHRNWSYHHAPICSVQTETGW